VTSFADEIDERPMLFPLQQSTFKLDQLRIEVGKRAKLPIVNDVMKESKSKSVL